MRRGRLIRERERNRFIRTLLTSRHSTCRVEHVRLELVETVIANLLHAL